MRITVVSPHRGDAAFALGLTIGAWLKRGHSVEVVNCFTRSQFAPYSDVLSLHENDRMSFATAIRKREDEAWRKHYGVAKLKLTDLSLKDAPARLHCKPEEVSGRAADVPEKVMLKIRKAIESSKGGALVLPLGIGAHIDYVSARDASIALVPEALPMAFYDELPFALGATPEMEEAVAHQLSLTLGNTLRRAPANNMQDSAKGDNVSQRRRMALCYDSQFDEKATAEIAGFGVERGGQEPLWVNTAWGSRTELNA